MGLDVKELSPIRYHCSGVPTFKKNIVNKALCKNRLTGDVYEFTKFNDTKGKWDIVTDENIIADMNGVVGKGSTINVGTVTTTTLPPNSQAKVTITDSDPSSDATFNFAFEIPEGKQGIPGSGGGGLGIPGIIGHNSNFVEFPVEIQVSGSGTTITVAQSGNTYPGITVAGSDLVDWANLQYGLYLANKNKKKLRTAGTFNVAKMVDLGKTSYYINWDGGSNTIVKTVNADSFAIVGRPNPVDNTDANQMIQATFDIRNITIIGNSAQVGFKPGPSYHSTYTNISSRYCKSGYEARFNLNATFFKCNTWNCNVGFLIANGDWPGASTSNSQSNQTVVTQCHVAGLWNGGKSEVGFRFLASSGCEMSHCIIEQGGCFQGVDFDYLSSPNVKDFVCKDTHIEGVFGNDGGANEAFFRVRVTGVALISGIYSQYEGMLVNAGGVGQCQTILERIVWELPKNGKSFYNAGSASFLFRDCSFQTPYKWDIAGTLSRFSGTPVSACYSANGAHCGPNTVTIQNLQAGSASRIVEVLDPTINLHMEMKPEEFSKLHVKLQAVTKEQDILCYTRAEAEAFAKANPDWECTITEIGTEIKEETKSFITKILNKIKEFFNSL